MNYSNLKQYGLSASSEKEAARYEGMFLARISEQHHQLYKVIGEQGELQASVSGKMLYAADGTLDFPAVGDWVMVDRLNNSTGDAVISSILERTSVLVRKAAGTSHEGQIVAANVDAVFICMSLNADFNLRRLERYLAFVWESRALPVIVLTKADLCDDLAQKLDEVAQVGAGVDVIVCSSREEDGYAAVGTYITPGKTIAFVGSSGVGKSTLINHLMGESVLATKEIRADDGKGRHATTHRQLLLLPGGGIVIDTPGMRELQLYTGDFEKTFEDVERLASQCRYRDCTHTSEPGCAVRRAREEGELSEGRFDNYMKLQREMSYEGLNSRQLEQAKIDHMFGGKSEMKQLMRSAKKKNKR